MARPWSCERSSSSRLRFVSSWVGRREALELDVRSDGRAANVDLVGETPAPRAGRDLISEAVVFGFVVRAPGQRETARVEHHERSVLAHREAGRAGAVIAEADEGVVRAHGVA